jgi:hypothetical protein
MLRGDASLLLDQGADDAGAVFQDLGMGEAVAVPGNGRVSPGVVGKFAKGHHA